MPRKLPAIDVNRRYKLHEAQPYLCVSLRTLRRRVAKQQLRIIRDGRLLFIAGAELARLCQ